MKNILVTFVLCIIFFHGLFAQSELEKKIKKEIWTDAPAEFKSITVPAKWEKESAVVLASSLDYAYESKSERVTLHYRVKLQDKASVSEYSELSFDKNVSARPSVNARSYFIVGVKVIKSNGTEKEIDLSTGVQTDAGSNRDFKIAIPDLEPGDVIDYYITTKKEALYLPNFSQMDILEEKYPIVKKTIRFKLPFNLHFYSSSYNVGLEFTSKIENKMKINTLVDTMREKAPDLLWSYSHRSAPEIRYSIKSTAGVPDQKRIARRVLSNFDYQVCDIGFIEDFMRGNFKDENNPAKITVELYNLLRNPIYMKAYFNIEQGKPLDVKYVPEQFFYLTHKYLLKRKIDHEILVVPGRNYGPMDDLVDLSTCELLIKVNSTPPIYIPRASPFGILNEIPYLTEGMTGVSTGGDTDPLPVSWSEKNLTYSTINISLNADDNLKMNAKRTVLAKGHNKSYHQYMVYTNYDYLKEYDLPKYQVQSSRLFKDLIHQNNLEKQKYEQRIKQDYDERDERIKKNLESDLDIKVSEYKNLSVKSIGMWNHSPDTEYSDEFILENLTSKAGPNYIIDLGRLIEKQTEVKEEQKIRTRDVYMSYPRTYTYDIVFNIPEGYSIEGLEKFNKKVENDLGGFISTATIKEKTLIISTKKYYTKNQCPASDWSKMLAFLNAAVDFQNEKILLKKQ